MGDANTGIEKSLLKNSAGLKANLLKTGHHGAKDASSEEFIKAVSPEYAVISADKNNAQGNPESDVTERLKNNGVKIFSTYRDGDIAFESDGKKIKGAACSGNINHFMNPESSHYQSEFYMFPFLLSENVSCLSPAPQQASGGCYNLSSSKTHTRPRS